uniref:SLX4 interacting protein n=2 Tax=Scleropages formosus TaxID=113540 RepID=A0A8C9REC1_SCLFO
GNFAVLVDLQVLPLGSAWDFSWWAEKHKEVSVLVQEVVEERVRLFQGARHQKGPQKHRKELCPASPVIIKGEQLHLAAYFLKRHVNLRCITRRQHGELRVFPERLVVRASFPEDEEELSRKENLAEVVESRQSKSKYFAWSCEGGEPLNSSTVTKRNTLQKIVKQAHAQHRSKAPGCEDPWGKPAHSTPTLKGTGFEEQDKQLLPLGVAEPRVQMPGTGGMSGAQREASLSLPEPGGTGAVCGALGPAPPSPPSESAPPLARLGQGKGKRGRSSSQEDRMGAKRVCPGRCPASPSEVIMKTDFAESLTQASAAQPPLAPELHFAAGAAQTKLEGELLTRGKSGPKAPPANSNTEQADQTELDAGVKELSVRPATPCSSVRSRASDRKEGEENVLRKSRLRRVKKA